MEGNMPNIRDWVAPDNKIKYVIISGNVAGRMARSRLDMSNFEAVMQFLKDEGGSVDS
ncbi:hypothetical protein [Cyclobacterium sp.]|uniref:hypothetical protein n=1 Tax=Cyclobacterium sp. TaxID=1966343 RepID=UPI001995BEF8|nr:hypothetical protein [Cyclobacterium sp.]MBD3630816.1 hypothetical protein [Cyclobacterium sp.]